MEERHPRLVHHVDWRNGPARLWYDFIGLPPDATSVDYGLKLKDQNNSINSDLEKKNFKNVDTSSNKDIMNENDIAGFCDDAFLMVTQMSWESDVIWDSNISREKV